MTGRPGRRRPQNRCATACTPARARELDGLITVTLLVEDNHITCIETTQEGESQSVGGYEAVRDGVYADMIDAAQGSDIDAVSGATITTAGIRQAVEAALAQARAWGGDERDEGHARCRATTRVGAGSRRSARRAPVEMTEGRLRAPVEMVTAGSPVARS